ncbi:MAG: hypothetical protein GF320_22250, partial [Armatimonadia bacterium]|nr:hypothetical protein [Armatimonadia bacterium]
MCGLCSFGAILPIALSAVILTASCSAQQAYAATLYYDPIHDASAVAIRDLDLRDTDRDRTLPIRVFAPTLPSAEGPLPTVVFSHGGGESREAFGYLGQAWARAGYLATFLTHPGSDRAVVNAQGMRALGASGGDDRPQDLSFVIDRLLAGDTGEPIIDGRVDPGRIA